MMRLDEGPRYHYHFIPFLLLLIYSLLLFWPIPFAPNYTIASEDVLNQFYPWTDFWVQEFRTNEFPLWNPHSFCGTPFIGNLQTAVFYPPQFLLALISPLRSIGWSFWLHTLMAGVGMYLLIFYLTRMRTPALAMGIAFMTGGFLMPRLVAGHVTIINSLPWAPLVVLMYLRWMAQRSWGRWTALAVVMAIQLLGGQPQIPYLTFYLVGVLAIGDSVVRYRKEKRTLDRALLPVGGFILALAVAVLLTIVYWLPCYELNRISAMRSAGLDYQEATKDSLPFNQFLALAAPFLCGDSTSREFWGSRQGSGYHEVCGFLGLGALVFLIIGLAVKPFPRKRIWITILVISLLLAFGRLTPLYRLAYWFVPGVRFFRVPARFLLSYSIIACILGGYGLKAWIQCRDQNKRLRIVALSVGCVFFACSLLGWGYLHWQAEGIQAVLSQGSTPINTSDFSLRQLVQDRWGDLVRALGIATLISGVWLVWLVLGLRWKDRKGFYGALAICLLALECGWFAHRFIQPRKTDEILHGEYAQMSPAIQFLEQHRDKGRLLRPDSMISWWTRKEFPQYFPNRLMLHKLQCIRGYDVTIPGDYATFLYAMQGRDVPERVGSYLHVAEPSQLNPRMLSLMNVRYLLLPYKQQLPGFRIMNESPPWIYQYESTFPRAFILPDNLSIPDRFPQDSTAEITSYSPNKIQIKAELSRKGWLVVSDNAYPGWEAESEGKPLKIEQVLGTFRGIHLEPGRYAIHMEFKPKSLKIGAWISGASLLALFALNIGVLWRKKAVRTKNLRMENQHASVSQHAEQEKGTL